MGYDIQQIADRFQGRDREMVLEAYSIAEKALAGRSRGNKHPFIEHPLGVAAIVSGETGLQADAVTAVFLHEANRFQGATAAEINSSAMLKSFYGRFPEDIVNMVRSLNNISFITLQQTGLDEERYRKLIISYSTDPRVVIIKLADRLEVLRNLDALPASKRNPKVTESMQLYAPLAHQLGLYLIKSEMEDIYLRCMEPEAYRAITNSLKATESEREALAVRFIAPLRAKLDRNEIKYTMKARTKSAYSIWKKMQAQKVPFEKIYDVFAMRFIIDCPPIRTVEHELCWKVYSLVTEEYEPDTSRLRDWLSKPKANGYESLHTTVTTREGSVVEVQIRTVRMDLEAEQGHASHWAYKGIKSEEVLSDWLNRVRDMMQRKDAIEYEKMPPELMKQIFVFTPSGDLRELHAGASVLDFAFDIHSNIGVKCTGGRVNGKMVPIREVLHTGDVVEIITGKNQKPNPDWLNFVVTSKARNKIRQKLKEEENKAAAEGKEMLSRRLRNWKLEMDDNQLAELVKKYKFKITNEFFAALGSGEIDPMEIKEFLTADERKEETPALQGTAQRPVRTVESSSASDYLVIGSGLGKVSYKMAKCCNPIFGDEVFGFVTIKDGLKIHRISCPNAARLLSEYPYRIQKVRWAQNADRTSSIASLKIVTVNDLQVTNAVISTVNMFKASIRSFNVVDRGSEQEIQMTTYVASNAELDKITASLRKLRDVRQVTRL
ncbi:MAG: bifunctional (p)ppGpp synthetase/guanosine-3',5'-bis(diphosphate) 3'-pyrophosphohydrolase [Bacteroidales bacterium]|nr:bifunctional (p)ppGpp synthetase/guanosine-3',5'-bis(diphosphate) 3'-pyrophosphohydrolase [Bacteroidales bacterium]